MEVIEKYNLKFEIENDITHFELVLTAKINYYQIRWDGFKLYPFEINELIDILNNMYQDYEIEYKEMMYFDNQLLEQKLKLVFGYRVLSEDEKETNRINYLIQRLL
jgi:hypothetical protein